MTTPEPTYITVDEVKENSSIAGLKRDSAGLIGDEDITMLIQTAEDQIDAYVGPQQHHQFDSNINRVFPRVQDFAVTLDEGCLDESPTTPEIPYKVSRACLRQVEWLFTQWYTSRSTSQIPSQYPLQSRNIGADGSYAETRARGGINFSEATVCDQAKALLNGFVSRMAAIATTDVRNSAYPRRDGAL